MSQANVTADQALRLGTSGGVTPEEEANFVGVVAAIKWKRRAKAAKAKRLFLQGHTVGRARGLGLRVLTADSTVADTPTHNDRKRDGAQDGAWATPRETERTRQATAGGSNSGSGAALTAAGAGGVAAAADGTTMTFARAANVVRAAAVWRRRARQAAARERELAQAITEHTLKGASDEAEGGSGGDDGDNTEVGHEAPAYTLQRVARSLAQLAEGAAHSRVAAATALARGVHLARLQLARKRRASVLTSVTEISDRRLGMFTGHGLLPPAPKPKRRREVCVCAKHRAPFVRIASHRWFDRFIVAAILANCVFLALLDPLDTNKHSTRNQILDTADLVFQIIYTVEMLIKCAAFGVVWGERAYVTQTWNLIDGALVISGWVVYLPFFADASLSSIRIVRVLRPLRTVQSVPGLKLLVNSMLASLPQLRNVVFLCIFMFLLFGITGVQVFGGLMDYRCMIPATDTALASLPAEDMWKLCDPGGGYRQCTAAASGNATTCMRSGVRPNQDITHFDNIGVAFLTIFQCITMEGWVDIMYWVEQAGRGVVGTMYFTALIALGAIFLVNVIVAVIVTTLSVENDIAWEEHLTAQADPTEPTSPHAATPVKRRRNSSNAAMELAHQRVLIKAASNASGLDPGSLASFAVSALHGVEGTPQGGRRLRMSSSSSHTNGTSRPGERLPATPQGATQNGDMKVGGEDGDGTGSNDANNNTDTDVGTPHARNNAVDGRSDGGLSQGSPRTALELCDGDPLAAAHDTKEGAAALPGGSGDLLAACATPEPRSHPWSPMAGAIQFRPNAGAERGKRLSITFSTTTQGATVHPATPEHEESKVRPVSHSKLPPASPFHRSKLGRATARTPKYLPPLERTGDTPSGDSNRAPAADGAAVPSRHGVTLPSQVSSGSGGMSMVSGTIVSTEEQGAPKTMSFMIGDTPTDVPADPKHNVVVVDIEQLKPGPSMSDFHAEPQAGSTPRLVVRRTVDSAPFRILILLLILVNTVVLSLEYHGMPDGLKRGLETANQALTIVFALEMALKLVAFGCRGYWRDSFNAFDGVLVIVSVVEIVFVAATGINAGGGVTAMRALRLLRVFKLARSWESLNTMLAAMASSLLKIAPFSIILLLFVFIYSLLGMQLFGGKLGNPAPRANYDTLMWSVVTTFQVITGENWNEVMYMCITEVGWPAVIFFVSEVVIGTYVVLNLFLAILIDHFTELSEQRDTAKMAAMAAAGALEDVAVHGDTFVAADNGARPQLGTATVAPVARAGEYPTAQGLVGTYTAPPHDVVAGAYGATSAPDTLVSTERAAARMMRVADAHGIAGADVSAQRQLVATYSRQILSDARTRVELAQQRRIEAYKRHARMLRKHRRRRCCGRSCGRFMFHPAFHNRSCGVFAPTHAVRYAVADAVLHPAFEAVITVLIFVGCVVLALDSGEASAELHDYVWLGNTILTTLFTLEMALKMFAFGVYRGPGAYMKDGWNLLDLFIVAVSLVDIALDDGTFKFVKVLRFLRALRPLRAVRRLRGLRVVINAVIRAFPGAMNVALVCVLFFFLYGILGVNFFKGTFYSCTDPSRTCLPRLAGEACTSDMACEGTWTPPGASEAVAREWVNAGYVQGRGTYSFDNSVVALMTLFEVASLELWHEVMYTAVDVVGVGWAPQHNSNEVAVFFFVAFIMFGSIFMLNLFVSVVVDNFRKMTKVETGGSMFMTADQRQWVEMKDIISRMRPAPLAAPPTSSTGVRATVFKLVAHPYFDLTIMALIVVNVIIMCTQHADQSGGWETVGNVSNIVFGAIFLVEMVVKHVGLGITQYWASAWNCFDGALVIVNLATMIAREAGGEELGIDITLFRVVRVFRIFRLVRTVPQLRLIFSTLMLSLPSMANVGMLLLLLFYMYAVMGMSLFGEVGASTFITDQANFRNFWRAFMLLIRMVTGESWNGIMHDVITPGDVLSQVVAYAYFGSFVVLAQFMMLNLFVAVILEQFEREFASDSISKVTSADLEFFADVWASMPRKGVLRRDGKHLNMMHLKMLLFRLGIPLGFDPLLDSRKYRMEFIAALDVHVHDIGGIQCVEYNNVLEQLVKKALTRGEEERILLGSERGRSPTPSPVNKTPLGARSPLAPPELNTAGSYHTDLWSSVHSLLSPGGGGNTTRNYRAVAAAIVLQRMYRRKYRAPQMRERERRRSSIQGGYGEALVAGGD